MLGISSSIQRTQLFSLIIRWFDRHPTKNIRARQLIDKAIFISIPLKSATLQRFQYGGTILESPMVGKTISHYRILERLGGGGMEYLSDGITESTINTLSQLPRLRVMARGTVFTYKGKEVDPRKVGAMVLRRIGIAFPHAVFLAGRIRPIF